VPQAYIFSDIHRRSTGLGNSTDFTAASLGVWEERM